MTTPSLELSEYPPFRKLGLPAQPIILAPLAGVSDHPFRRTCTAGGADLTYVEMISATALNYDSPRTLQMMARHDTEQVLGIQVTGKTATETAQAIGRLQTMPFDTIDINMGCPVKKVVKTGCGSAILKDPERVYQTVKLCRQATDKPFSVKIRLGWDRNTINGITVARAAYEAGADWITVHGRTRACDYATAVDLNQIAAIVAAVPIPVIGNGNIFGPKDAATMMSRTGASGVMVSRGALGNPWVFDMIKGKTQQVGLEAWYHTVKNHLIWQQEAYPDSKVAAICMRKHLLWYTKGWSQGKFIREAINKAESLSEARAILDEFYQSLKGQQSFRFVPELGQEQRFSWDPKYEMDRQWDRGVGDDQGQVATAGQQRS